MAKSKRGHSRKWTGKEVALLKELYPECPVGEIAERFGRTVGAIKVKACYLGLKRKSYLDKLWTGEEIQLLRELYPSCKSARELAEKIGRPSGSVRQIALRLGIARERRPMDYDMMHCDL